MTGESAEAPWVNAALAAGVFAVDPAAIGGLSLRARAGPVREAWLALLTELAGNLPTVRVPLRIGDDELLGGLDLAATLAAGRPISTRGLVATADGGLLILTMAERLESRTAAIVTAAMDTSTVQPARVGATESVATRFGVLALDEGADDDETPPAGLMDRLAIHVDLGAVSIRDVGLRPHSAKHVAAARERLPFVTAGEEVLEALCETAAALGIDSLRAPMLALRVARIGAALAGRDSVAQEDIILATRLVLGPRATMMPSAEPRPDSESVPDEPERQENETPGDKSQPEGPESQDEDRGGTDEEQVLAELLIEAARATLPAGMLDGSRLAAEPSRTSGAGSGAGGWQAKGKRGRPAGVRRGEPGPDARLNVIETLRAAAPWQRLRAAPANVAENRRVRVRRDDFRVTRYKTRRETATIFVVDASGSAAMHRLAEAKGAVELLLADCYVRRDRVALIAFRGQNAELLLAPTRSLLRAKRSLAGLPGGGGTPLPAGLKAAFALCEQVRRGGATPIVVLLTDGRGNIDLDGEPNRETAREQSLGLGRQFRFAGITSLLVDTSPRPRPAAEELATAMGADYLPLPQAEASELSKAIRSHAT